MDGKMALTLTVRLDVEGQMTFTIIMFNCRQKLLTIKGGSNSKEERVKL